MIDTRTKSLAPPPVEELILLDRACDACGSIDCEPLWSYAHVVRTRSRSFRFSPRHVVCKGCGFAFVSPVPDQKDLNVYYSDAFSKFQGQPVGYDVESRVSTLTRWAPKGGVLLEVGSNAGGLFRSACLEHFADVLSVEPNTECETTLDRIVDAPEAHADALAHYYVLEHVQNPVAFLRDCRRALRDGGVMVCEVPTRRLYPMDATDLLFWEHLSHFSRYSLTRLASLAGFELVEFIDRGTCAPPVGVAAVFRAHGHNVAYPPPRPAREEVDEAVADLSAGVRRARQFLTRLAEIREEITIRCQRGERIALWGANDIMRRLVPESLPSGAFALDDDPRKTDFLDREPVQQPLAALDHLQELDWLLVTNQRNCEKIVKRAGELRGRPLLPAEWTSVDYNEF